MLGCWSCPAGVARKVNYQVALADVVGQLVKQGVAALLEVFLHLDFVGMVFERAELVGQPQAIRFEFSADTG